jgi:histidinol-phosphatase (PHP family)
VRFGVEITYESAREDEIRGYLARNPHDFVIGSVHVGPDSPYRAEHVASWVAGRSLAAIVEPYFGEVVRAARSRLFDTIGHLDFVKRYLQPHVSPADLGSAPELYEPVLAALVETGTSLEVNSSGLRQSPGETYPAAAVVARYRALGGEAVTAGSDAHRIDSFAFGLAVGYQLIGAAGFEAVAFRRGGVRVAVRIGHVRTAPNTSSVRSL